MALCVILLAPAGPLAAAPPPPGPLVDATAAMAELLARLDREADARRNPFLNDRALATIRAMIPEGTPFESADQEVRYRLLVGLEALRAGETELAVSAFERLLELVAAGAALGEESTAASRHYLGLAYLRLAEEENCVSNPSIDRCLLPIRGGGVHARERGGRGALRVYSALLEDHPDDLRFLWLANLAAQVLGEHPGALPERFRIPPAAYERGADFPRFPDVAPRLGLDVFSLAGGVVADDLDGDGDLDLAMTSWGLDDPLRIFVNERGSFRETTSEAGVAGMVGGLNLIHGDGDGDGRIDLLVLRGAWMGEEGLHPNSFLRNLGDGRFADVTASAGLLTFHPTQTGAWADFDGDGDLDLFVGNESTKLAAHPSELWRNRGDGTFEEVAAAAGVRVEAFVKGVLWDDVDDDGRPDLFLSVLDGPNRLYRNRGPAPEGGWRFDEISESAGITEPRVAFPAAFLDVDQDGRTDLWVSSYRATIAETAAEHLGREVDPSYWPRLHRNLGGGRFEDATGRFGLDTVLATMGLGFGDLDNDGFLDLYAGTGNTPLETLMPNRMFRNVGGERFEDVTVAGGFGHLQKGHGIAFADFDQDGDQDVYAVVGGAHPGDGFWNALFENPGFGRPWVRLELRGTGSNRLAIGAKVAIRTARADSTERTLWRTVSPGTSFGGNPLRLEVGLGDAVRILGVEVRWPRLEDGEPVVETFSGVEPGASWELLEGTGRARRLERPPIPFRTREPAGHTGHGR